MDCLAEPYVEIGTVVTRSFIEDVLERRGNEDEDLVFEHEELGRYARDEALQEARRFCWQRQGREAREPEWAGRASDAADREGGGVVAND